MGNACSCLHTNEAPEPPRKDSLQDVPQKYSNGDSYVGKLKDGMRHGAGVYMYKKGGKYVGEFVNGQSEGKGEFYYNNGEMYQGEW
jgi:hypothetical protein